MDLKTVADILKAGVEPTLCDSASLMQKIREGGPKNRQDFTYKGRTMRLILTEDILPPNMRKFWHLSIGVLDKRPLDDDMVVEIVAQFFDNPTEMPSPLHSRNNVRHFIQRCEEDPF